MVPAALLFASFRIRRKKGKYQLFHLSKGKNSLFVIRLHKKPIRVLNQSIFRKSQLKERQSSGNPGLLQDILLHPQVVDDEGLSLRGILAHVEGHDLL